MSILPADVHQELEQLLQALQSRENATRSQAEEHLQANWTNTRPEVLLMGLAEQVQASQDTAVRPPPLLSSNHPTTTPRLLPILCIEAYHAPHKER